MRILLVEDDRLLGSSTRQGLEQEGFLVDWVTDGHSAATATGTQRYDVIVLDLGLPHVSGDELLHRWRTRRERTPVVVLTARGDVADRVRVLESGADDYLIKPFDLLELCARIRAVTRRAAGESGDALECGDLKLFPGARVVTWRGRRVEVTDTELCLLETLLRNRNRVLTRRQLEEAMHGWGDASQ
ncbi:MAG: response regulator transcription factor, partial [Vicinamibacterales bacterium]